MNNFRMTLSVFARRGLLFALPILLIGLAACDSSPTANDDDDHLDGERVELHTRGAASALLAVWTADAGWTDGNGASISELPPSVDVEGEGLVPLRARGTNASLTVQYFLADGSEVQMGTLSRDDVTRERQCTEYNVRYYPTVDDTDVIAWPNMRHPDSPDGAFQFARRANNDLVGIFHCDHIHFYPEREGTVDVEFHLWHIDHSDSSTDPLTIRVEEGAEPARFELQTRGAAQAMLAVWTVGEGWTDGDGSAITRIETPRDVEGAGLQPLVAFGSNSSLTLRYFAAGGEQVPFSTVSRDDVTRERVCTSAEARYLVEGESTDVIAWPNRAHPDNPTGETQFTERTNGDLVGIFHCDHIHFYPEAAGEVDLRMVMWEDGEVAAMSDPITVVVIDD